MRKIIALMLALILCINIACINTSRAEDRYPDFIADEDFNFDSLDDPAFLQYIEDSVYAQLEAEYAENGSHFEVDDVSVVYISREYLEEVAYNTRANIFFGYSLAQINEVFQGEKYVFSLSDDGKTIVQEYIEIPDDTYDRIIKNVLIGAGIILVCVTVSVLTAGAAAPAAGAGGASAASIAMSGSVTAAAKIHLIASASAHTASLLATKSAIFAGATKLVTRGFETGWDFDAMAESAAVASSEAFKWSAISGTILGGAGEALRIRRISRGALKPREAEQAAQALYGGREQVTYLNGEEVPYGTLGGTRPDIVIGNEAIEVKCYDLSQATNLYELRKTLTDEISQRVINLPAGMTQRIVLNVQGRGYTELHVMRVINWLKEALEPIYPDIPIDVMGEML